MPSPVARNREVTMHAEPRGKIFLVRVIGFLPVATRRKSDAFCPSIMNPPPDLNIIKSYKKIGLVRLTSDEQLFVTKRRFNREDEGRGGMGASMGLIGLLLEEGTREARRSGFAATQKPINDAVKRNMRPELEKLLFSKVQSAPGNTLSGGR